MTNEEPVQIDAVYLNKAENDFRIAMRTDEYFYLAKMKVDSGETVQEVLFKKQGKLARFFGPTIILETYRLSVEGIKNLPNGDYVDCKKLERVVK